MGGDHATGKRRRYERPEREWIRREDEALRIVPEETWQRVAAARERRAAALPRDEAGRLLRGNGGARAGYRGRGRWLLSGFLECAECAGALFDAHGRGMLSCGWRRDRGPEVCSSTLEVPRDELESRVLVAMRERVLTPETVSYIVEQSLAEAEKRLGRTKAVERDRAQLAESEIKVDRAALRALIIDTVREINEALAGDVERARGVLRALLGDRRLRVGPDPERGFRMDGMLELTLEGQPARGSRRRAGRVGGSGGGI